MAALAIMASLGQAAEMTVPLVVYANVECIDIEAQQWDYMPNDSHWTGGETINGVTYLSFGSQGQFDYS